MLFSVRWVGLWRFSCLVDVGPGDRRRGGGGEEGPSGPLPLLPPPPPPPHGIPSAAATAAEGQLSWCCSLIAWWSRVWWWSAAGKNDAEASEGISKRENAQVISLASFQSVNGLPLDVRKVVRRGNCFSCAPSPPCHPGQNALSPPHFNEEVPSLLVLLYPHTYNHGTRFFPLPTPDGPMI